LEDCALLSGLLAVLHCQISGGISSFPDCLPEAGFPKDEAYNSRPMRLITKGPFPLVGESGLKFESGLKSVASTD
jgi:hypothetical protein